MAVGPIPPITGEAWKRLAATPFGKKTVSPAPVKTKPKHLVKPLESINHIIQNTYPAELADSPSRVYKVGVAAQPNRVVVAKDPGSMNSSGGFALLVLFSIGVGLTVISIWNKL